MLFIIIVIIDNYNIDIIIIRTNDLLNYIIECWCLSTNLKYYEF